MLTKSLLSLPAECSTRDVAQALGLAVRSVQLMVDRGDLEAWKTPGGHRRISRASVERWVARCRQEGPAAEARAGVGTPAGAAAPEAPPAVGGASQAARRAQVLLIEDSAHFQNLVRLLLAHNFPEVDLHVAEDGIVGLAMAGALRPDVLLVDILLPGIDGAALIARLRSHPQFGRSRLIVLTSLDEEQRGAYAYALADLPVVHKPRMVEDLPVLLREALHA
jgi:excisionase family DNA binding protein